MRDLYDVKRNLNPLFMSGALFLGALKRIEGKHSGIPLGADLIGHVHGVITQTAQKIAIKAGGKKMAFSFSLRGMVFQSSITFCIFNILH